MMQRTTIHLRPGPTLGLRAPELGDDLRRLAAIAVHVFTGAILVISVATAIVTAPERVTGDPARLTEPSLLVWPDAGQAPAVVVEPAAAPSPEPGF